MADTIGSRVRLRVRIGKGLTTEATSLSVVVAGKEVTITSQDREEPLSAAKWLILSARSFATENEAQLFGTRLCSILQLVGLSLRLGFDVGENKATSWINEEFARSIGLIEDHQRVAQNIHGLMVLPDDDHTRFPISNAQMTVTASPESFTSSIKELGESGNIDLGQAANGVRLLNTALMTSDPLGQIVLAISAVEELKQKELNKPQKALLERLARDAEKSTELLPAEGVEVAEGIRRSVHPIGLRQGVKRLLSDCDQSHLWGEWERLYSIRSKLFHKGARLPTHEVREAAADTITLCGKIILAIITKEGGKVPSIAAANFSTNAAA